MKKVLVWFVLLIFSYPWLNNLYAKNDTTAIQAKIKSLEEFYDVEDYKKTDSLAKLILMESKKANYLLGEGYANYYQGLVFFENEDYIKAVEIYQQSLKSFIRLGDSEMIPMVYNQIGLSLKNIGKYIEAINAFNQGLYLARRHENYETTLLLSLNKGIVFRNMGDYLESIISYRESLQIALKKNDQKILGSIYGNLGNIYLDLGFNEKSITFFNSANIYFKKFEKRKHMSILLW